MTPSSLKALFEVQAARRPDAMAAVCAGRQVTFGALNARANRIARRLRAHGVGPDQPVGIHAARSLDMLAAVLAVVKAGGAYLPLDPGYPPEPLAFMLDDARLTCGLCGGEAAAPRHSGVEWIELGDPTLDLEDEDDLAPLGVQAERLAYVVYTSGSTGRPKGVMGTEQGMLNRLDWMWRCFPFQGDEVGCVKTSLNFLDSFWEIFGPLLQGVPVLLATDEQVKDPLALVDALAGASVTRLVLVPSLLRALLRAVPNIGLRLSRLRLWVSSGEALTPDLVQAFRQALPGARLLNLYGSSEVSADCTWCDACEDASERVPIGHPIDNNVVRLLDERLMPVPAGDAGQLFVAGAGLARGYLRRPELTAERFLPDPEGPAGGRMYWSGDLARQRGDGALEFVGRVDQQVKLRGFRVELGAIEAALRCQPEVSEAVVALREDRPGNRQLVGYVIAAADARAEPTALREALARRLPDYMLPAAIVVLARWPLTPSGKIDRTQLPAPRFTPAGRAPRSAAEETLARLFAEVLELEQVGIDDKFFDLGGDSISSMDLVGRARAAGYELTTGDVFQRPTVAALAAAVEDRAGAPRA